MPQYPNQAFLHLTERRRCPHAEFRKGRRLEEQTNRSLYIQHHLIRRGRHNPSYQPGSLLSRHR
jgi:hypothetical protein